MATFKSLDDVRNIIAALLLDVHHVHGVVFNKSAYRLTCQKVCRRVDSEGKSFLTKTLPRLGKCFDKALAGEYKLTKAVHGFKTMRDSELPMFMGELFSKVFAKDGEVLPEPCTLSVRTLRDILYLFYKYELPYKDEDKTIVVQSFEKTEQTINDQQHYFATLSVDVAESYSRRRRLHQEIDGKRPTPQVAREAKILLSRVFSLFDLDDITPRHGPGVVATKQRLWDKFRWTNVAKSITNHYPFDAYFCASAGHVCDSYDTFNGIAEESLPARVILVPKDSRGPRLISCEPVDFQWIQQGISRAIVKHVEAHPLTRNNVHFTDQEPNRCAARYGSISGKYSTLDLNEASDRVSLDLVSLLFPPHIFARLEACRSSSTVLPSGKKLELKKFAPMGSSLCFPVLALVTWAILTAGAPDADTREGILVYGDDVIVPTAYAANAIEHLESFGLKVNRDKSCTKGSFRESCGMDAFKGICVTPVRLRTVWSSEPSPDVYTSWIAYANSFYDRRYYALYDLVVENLHHIYGAIPDEDMHLACPSLRIVAEENRPKQRRYNKSLQKLQYKVYDVKAKSARHTNPGWLGLLRYFTEGTKTSCFSDDLSGDNVSRMDWTFLKHLIDAKSAFGPIRTLYTGFNELSSSVEPFSVSLYTCRHTSILVRRWR